MLPNKDSYPSPLTTHHSPRLPKRWYLHTADESLVTTLARELKLSPLVARILVQRGFGEVESARRFLSSTLASDLPSPFLLAGMDAAVARISEALIQDEKVCVWGDYDVDGTTGAAVLVSFLREIGMEPLFYIPHRVDEGYGLSRQGLEWLQSQGVRLVVSVDCGISNADEVGFARELGIDVVIVDHHLLPERMPESAVAIVNPQRADCEFPDKGLCGAGLAFYVVIGLRAKLRSMEWFENKKVPDIRRHLDIVTLGTIADMVPLRGTNRVLTRRGLVELSGSQRPGIQALREVAGVSPGEIDVGTVAFQLGPRINAAGRMDAALKVVEMLTTDSMEAATAIARELDDHNRERRETEAQVLFEALTQIEAKKLTDRWSIVVADRGWHPGVLGIVASRIVERFHRPTIVIGFANGEGKGSGRSIRGFHMVKGMERCADLLAKFGGHEYAGGLSIVENNIESFADRFEQVAREVLSEEDLSPFLELDAEVDFSEINLGVARNLSLLGPFGIGNPEPVFQTSGVTISDRRDFKGVTRFRLTHQGLSVTAVSFGRPEELSGQRNDRIDIAYKLKENEWQGTVALELRLLDIRRAQR